VIPPQKSLPRAIQLFAAAVAFCEASLYGVLAPLLPALAGQAHLSATAAGLLSAGYPIGVVLAALPAGLAAARRPRGTAVCGLWLVTVACVGFALGRTGVILGAARLLQGAGAAAAWGGALAWIVRATHANGRGEALAITVGAASAGTMLAPVLAALANAGARTVVFLVMAGLLAVVSAWGGPPGVPQLAGAEADPSPRASPASRLNRREAPGYVMMALIGIALGVCGSLGSLLLSGDGVSNRALAAVFFFANAPSALMARQLGRVIDRHRAREPMMICMALLAAGFVCVSFVSGRVPAALLVGVLVAVATAGLTAAYALISEGAERHGSNQGVAMALSNGAWGAGAAIGAGASTTIAHALAPSTAFLPVAAVCLCALGWLGWTRLQV
jgi:predicted MFS family arabinose efflux permease